MNESIGAQLRQAREQKHLTIQQVSETTKIRSHYLQALENDDLSAIPSVAQARGFLRIYAALLGLKIDEMVPPPAPLVVVSETPVSESALGPAAKPARDAQAPSPGFLTQILDRLSRLKPQMRAAPPSDAPYPANPVEQAQPASRVASNPAPTKKKVTK
jgi:transcriptional regulator with XRE-family HTH domain